MQKPLQQLYLEKDLQKACNDFNDNENLVGEGGFGKVYKGILHGKAIVVKIPQSMNNDFGKLQQDDNYMKKVQEDIEKEMKIMYHIPKHDNIVFALGKARFSP